jgi:hypothetical protein
VKRVLSLILICFTLTACSADSSSQTKVQVTKEENHTPQPTNTPADAFEVKAWVDKPNPTQEERVTLHGSLIKNGVFLGGMMMSATWPDPDHERGVPNCTSLVTYGAGKCAIEANKFPQGQFVPITVSFDYQGKRYTGQTGFTPR